MTREGVLGDNKRGVDFLAGHDGQDARRTVWEEEWREKEFWGMAREVLISWQGMTGGTPVELCGKWDGERGSLGEWQARC